MRHLWNARRALCVCLVLAIALILGVAPLGAQASVIVEASADSYVRADGWANDNFGCTPEIAVGSRYGSAPFYGLIQFDLASLAGRPIASARLQLTIWGWGWGTTASIHRIQVHRLLPTAGRTPWIEGIGTAGPQWVPGNVCIFSDNTGGVSWVTELKTHVAPPVQVIQYPDYDPAPSAMIAINRVSYPVGSVVELDITGLVQGWLSGSYANFGLLLRDANSVGTEQLVGFGARDGLLRNIWDRGTVPPVAGPRLIVDLSNQPPVVTADLTSVVVSEGQMAANTGTVNDPDGDPVSLNVSVGSVSVAGDQWAWQFQTRDGPSDSQMVLITADDLHGGTSSAAFALVVENVPPVVGPLVSQTVYRNDLVSFSGSFSDPGALDTHTVVWDFGDGSGTSGTLTPTHVYTLEGTYPVMLTVTDKDGGVGSAAATVTVLNRAPSCAAAYPSSDFLWPPQHQMVDINILGVTDPESDPIAITVTSIWQDEPTNGTGDGDISPDGLGVGTPTASVRAERSARGNGRMYQISFGASDGHAGTCSGVVLVGVNHDQGRKGQAVNDGALYDATVP